MSGAKTRLVIDGDERISVALMSYYVVLTSQYFILISLNLQGTTWDGVIRTASKALVALAFGYVLPTVLRRNKAWFFGTYFVSGTLFLLHYLLFPENRIYQRELSFAFFCMCLPAFNYALSIREWRVLRQKMVRTSHVVFVLSMLLTLQVVRGKASVGLYSQSLGYYLLLPAVMYTSEFMNSASLKNAIPSLLAFCSILLLGSRGPVLWIGCVILLRMARPSVRLRHAEAFGRLTILVAGLVLALSSDVILERLDSLLYGLGLRSRTLMLLLTRQDQIGIRGMLYREVLSQVMEHPIVGLGIGGDRHVLRGSYVHNVFLEVMADFGVLVGMSIILVLMATLIHCLRRGDMEEYEMLVIWIGIGLLPLLVSGSYLTSLPFWVLAGLLTSRTTARHRTPPLVGSASWERV